MSPDTIEAVRCALQTVCETGGTMDELALIEQADRIADLKAENERLENLLAEGVHSCSQTCKRPMCVLRREKAELERQLAGCDNCGYAGQDLTKYRELLQKAHDNARDERISELEQQLAESQASEKEWFRLSKELGGALASLRKAIEKHKHTIHEKCPEDTLLWAALKEQDNG